jgi:hypothetical protein
MSASGRRPLFAGSIAAAYGKNMMLQVDVAVQIFRNSSSMTAATGHATNRIQQVGQGHSGAELDMQAVWCESFCSACIMVKLLCVIVLC